MGFEIHRPRWGRGLATEGAVAALRFGFGEHGLPRIIGVTAPWHAAVRRVMEKAGLTSQGTRPYRGLEPEPIVYAIDRATWERRERDALR